MIIAITGGSGFVGQQLLRYYVQKGYEVRVLSRKELKKGAGFDLFYGDLSDSKVDLSNFVDKVDILFHCAGEIRNESLMEGLHVGGTKRLVDAAKGKIGRWVQLSSVGAYGINRGGIISGVLYILIPDDNCGGITFERTDEGLQYYLPPFLDKFNESISSTFTIKPKEGSLILFPSWFKHRVEPSQSQNSRISMSFNYTFTNFLGWKV